MIELKENTLYTNKELAEWFGMKQKSFSNQKEKKLEELKAFADYELQGNVQKKVFVKKVYEPIYNKKGSESY